MNAAGRSIFSLNPLVDPVMYEVSGWKQKGHVGGWGGGEWVVPILCFFSLYLISQCLGDVLWGWLPAGERPSLLLKSDPHPTLDLMGKILLGTNEGLAITCNLHLRVVDSIWGSPCLGPAGHPLWARLYLSLPVAGPYQQLTQNWHGQNFWSS